MSHQLGTYNGALQTARLGGFRHLKYIMALLSLGILAPFVLQFQKQITRTHYFVEDMKISKKKKDQERDQNRDDNITTNSPENTEDQTPLVPSDATDSTVEKEPNCWGRNFKPYFTELHLFHQAPMTKISYTIIFELVTVFYYSYYLRNCMSYQWGKVRVQHINSWLNPLNVLDTQIFPKKISKHRKF